MSHQRNNNQDGANSSSPQNQLGQDQQSRTPPLPQGTPIHETNSSNPRPARENVRHLSEGLESLDENQKQIYELYMSMPACQSQHLASSLSEPPFSNIPRYNGVQQGGQSSFSRYLVHMGSSSSVPSSSVRTSTVCRPRDIEDLVDRLVRTFIPGFIQQRALDSGLSIYRDREACNPRARADAVLTTCVECGWKFCKQILYTEPASERQAKRQADQLLRKANAKNGPNKENGRRSASRPRVPLRMLDPHWYNSDGSRTATNSVQTTIDANVLNNNRRDPTYDGNLDYVSIKEEHDIDRICPRSLNANNGGQGRSNVAKKLPLGWEAVLGHNFSHIPIPRLEPGSDGEGSSSTGGADARQRRENIMYFVNGPHYPARSLIAGFVSILPRTLVLTQNEIRKLFAYYIWHPFFDTDLQAITLREAYRELWPYFLLADEDSEPTQDQVDNLVMRRRKRQRSVKLRRDRIRQRRQQGAQCPQINQGQEMQNDNPDGGQSPSSSKNDRDIEQSSGDKGKNIANDEDEAERFREKARLVSMAGRFTTSFEASLRHHKVIIDRRRITDAEACRAECLARRGWNIDRYGVDGQEDETVPADEEEEDEDEDEDEEDEDEEDEDGDDGDDDGDNQDQDELSTNGVAGGKRVIKKVRQVTTYLIGDGRSTTLPLNLSHHNYTRVGDPDTLERIQVDVEAMFRRAESHRQELGFVMPNFRQSPDRRKRHRERVQAPAVPGPVIAPNPLSMTMTPTSSDQQIGSIAPPSAVPQSLYAQPTVSAPTIPQAFPSLHGPWPIQPTATYQSLLQAVPAPPAPAQMNYLTPTQVDSLFAPQTHETIIASQNTTLPFQGYLTPQGCNPYHGSLSLQGSPSLLNNLFPQNSMALQNNMLLQNNLSAQNNLVLQNGLTQLDNTLSQTYTPVQNNLPPQNNMPFQSGTALQNGQPLQNHVPQQCDPAFQSNASLQDNTFQLDNWCRQNGFHLQNNKLPQNNMSFQNNVQSSNTSSTLLQQSDYLGNGSVTTDVSSSLTTNIDRTDKVSQSLSPPQSQPAVDSFLDDFLRESALLAGANSFAVPSTVAPADLVLNSTDNGQTLGVDSIEDMVGLSMTFTEETTTRASPFEALESDQSGQNHGVDPPQCQVQLSDSLSAPILPPPNPFTTLPLSSLQSLPNPPGYSTSLSNTSLSMLQSSTIDQLAPEALQSQSLITAISSTSVPSTSMTTDLTSTATASSASTASTTLDTKESLKEKEASAELSSTLSELRNSPNGSSDGITNMTTGPQSDVLDHNGLLVLLGDIRREQDPDLDFPQFLQALASHVMPQDHDQYHGQVPAQDPAQSHLASSSPSLPLDPIPPLTQPLRSGQEEPSTSLSISSALLQTPPEAQTLLGVNSTAQDSSEAVVVHETVLEQSQLAIVQHNHQIDHPDPFLQVLKSKVEGGDENVGSRRGVDAATQWPSPTLSNKRPLELTSEDDKDNKKPRTDRSLYSQQ